MEGGWGWETFVVFVPTSLLSFVPPRFDIISGLLDSGMGNCAGVACGGEGESRIDGARFGFSDKAVENPCTGVQGFG